MEVEMMRKELHEMIAKGDDGLIADLYDVAKDYCNIPQERMKLIMQEREDYLNGKGKFYNREEAKNIVRNGKPKP